MWSLAGNVECGYFLQLCLHMNTNTWENMIQIKAQDGWGTERSSIHVRVATLVSHSQCLGLDSEIRYCLGSVGFMEPTLPRMQTAKDAINTMNVLLIHFKERCIPLSRIIDETAFTVAQVLPKVFQRVLNIICSCSNSFLNPVTEPIGR